MINRYRNKINKWSENNKNKTTIKWTELQETLGIDDYLDFVDTVKSLNSSNIINGIGCTFNGRKPALHSKYRIIKEDIDYSEFIDEINYTLTPKIDKTYLKKNIKYYIENRDNIIKINNFILFNLEKLNTSISINERSFQIFGKEKELRKSKSLIKKLGLEENFFNYYETSEPIAYYSKSKKSPQNILIIENKDTFYTIRKYIKEEDNCVLGLKIDTVIYGGGKSKIPSLKEFKYYTEDYISNPNNSFYYFGDVDYEGIVIYESYKNKTLDEIDLKPFTSAYKYIVDKCISFADSLPTTKEGQNKNIGDAFFISFDKSYRDKIFSILKNDKYIPQEALNYEDLIKYKKGDDK